MSTRARGSFRSVGLALRSLLACAAIVVQSSCADGETGRPSPEKQRGKSSVDAFENTASRAAIQLSAEYFRKADDGGLELTMGSAGGAELRDEIFIGPRSTRGEATSRVLRIVLDGTHVIESQDASLRRVGWVDFYSFLWRIAPSSTTGAAVEGDLVVMGDRVSGLVLLVNGVPQGVEFGETYRIEWNANCASLRAVDD